MASNDLGEFTPLVPGSNGNHNNGQHHHNHHHHNNDMNDNNSMARRRGPPGMMLRDTTTTRTSHSEYEDFSATAKKYRRKRNYWVQFQETLATMMPVIRGQVRARTADCNPSSHHDLECGGTGRGSNDEYNDDDDDDEERLYYMDTYNDESWSCSFGTREHDGIWLNVYDRVGTLMSSLVWVLILYSGITVGLLSQHNHLPPILAKTYFTICALALASHAKTTFTDPGAIPSSAVPVDVYSPAAHAMCSRCQSYKPKGTHHCRICDRCISGMDHHCPWMNNCIGTGNMKHFILFLCYTWTACAFALMMFGWNYFFCSNEYCTFSLVLVQLVRVMTLLCISTLIFTSSMLTNVTYGVMTGVGTIDRLKMKADDTWGYADDEPLELTDIFGVGDYWTWVLPFFDPVFEDYDLAMGYSTPQRLLRERVVE